MLDMQSNPFLAIQSAFQARSAQLACAAINHLLNLEPTVQAHLKAHAGRSVLLRWEAMLMLPSGEQRFTIGEDLTLSTSDALSAESADVTVSLQAGLLQASSDERLRFIRIEGDALLAQDLSLIAKQLRWDAEHDLSRVIGGPAAHWVAANAQKGAKLFQHAVEQFKSNASDAVIHYPGWAVSANALQAHKAELIALKARIEALAARMTGAKR
jgi:ubiquinone biosynthesis accessory factor UbiJ